MVIYSSGGTPIISIKVDDSSYRYEEIMGDSNVYLEFSLTEHIEIDPGSYILFQGVKYEMMTRENVSIQHNRNYEYKVTFSGPQARFERYVMYNTIDGRLRFEMIGKPLDLLTMVVNNLNLREPQVWSIGSYINKEERLLSFNHTNVRDALNTIAEAFDTEWSVEPYGGGFAINLRKNEFNKSNPLALGYGKNQGFKPGVGRYNYGDFGQVEKVWIDGGERNLSIGEYGYTTLHFPKDFTFSHDARDNFRYTIDGQMYTENKAGGFDSNTAIAFSTDAYGASVKIMNAADNCVEASLDLTEYYPKRIGTVTDVRYLYKGQYLTYTQLIALDEVIWEEVQVDIIDSTLDDDVVSGFDSGLDYSQCLFSNNDPLVVIFQDGMLAGREFNATFIKEAKTITQINEQTGQEETIILRPANRFELERTTIDGVDMPNLTFRPNTSSESDKYIVTNCYLPKEYICDFAHFRGAELDALREACKFIRENKDPQFTFKGTVDDLYAMRNWLNISGKLILGGCISFQDASIQPTPIVTRIVGIKNYINNPYAPEVTLSNETVKGGMASTLAKLRGEDEKVVERVKEARRFSMRSFRDAKETIEMLAGTIDYFDEGINPITVETMSLLVGYEALQFKFWTSRMCTVRDPDPTHYDPDTHMFSVRSCVIQHMTHGITDVVPSGTRQYYDFLRWSMSSIEFGPLTGVDEQGNDNTSSAYYLYAKVDAGNVAKPDSEMTSAEAAHIYGEFVLSKEKKEMKEKLTPTDTEYHVIDGTNTEFSYFYLLVGILNSEHDGTRSFAPMYGFTEVLPGQITTDVIRSGSGDSYFDLANNQFALGNRLTFINNVLTLRGAFVQTGSGDITVIGAWCGEWDSTRMYQLGDEVWAEVNGVVSTYRYVNSVPSSGHLVTDSNYWIPVAEGTQGSNGQSTFKSTVFKRSSSTLTAPIGGSYTSPLPDPLDGWSDGIPSGETQLWMTTRIFTDNGLSPQQSGWTTPQPVTDTADIDFEFSSVETNPGTPTSNPSNWHNTATSDDIWMAVRKCNNGIWGSWEIAKIKGESGADGDDGDSIEVQWSADGTTWHSSYQTGDLYMRQRVGDASWSSAIRVVGEGGESIYTSFVFKASATQPETPVGTNPVPVGWSDSPPDQGESSLSATFDSNFTASGTTHHLNSISHEESIWGKITFSANSGDVVRITIRASSEQGYDFGYLSRLDDDSQSSSSYTAKVSGTESSTVTLNIQSTGSHFVYVGYEKDRSQDRNDDTIYVDSVKIITGGVLPIWFSSSIVTDGVSDGNWSTPTKLTGSDGNGILSAVVEYQAHSDGTTTPVGTWSDTPVTVQPGQYLWTRTTTFYTDGTTSVSYSVARQGINGENGKAPASPYAGVYSPNKLYYGTETRTDIVYYESTGMYYIAKPTAGEEFNVIPTNQDKWIEFGASYDSIATGLLFAEKAFIEKGVVGFLETYTKDSSAKIQAEENWLQLYDSNGVPRFRLTGDEISVGTPINVYSIPSLYRLRRYKSSSGTDTISEEVITDIDVAQGDTITIPSVSATIGLDNNNASTTTTLIVTLYKGSNAIANRTATITNSGESTRSGSTSSYTKTNADAGTYWLTIELSISYTITGTNPIAVYTADVVASGALSVSGTNKQMVQIGANGLVAHLTGGFSAVIATDPDDNDNPKIILQGMKNGDVVGIRIDATDGIMINKGDGNGWKPPLLAN